MTSEDRIRAEVDSRGITRICHFTPSRNLAQIVSGTMGILATTKLLEDERQVFAATDRLRLDSHPDHICCSVEYPNGWYFDKARAQEILFKDWVVLLIKPTHLWAQDTKFSPRNAAAGGGSYLRAGADAFAGMYESSVSGAGGRRFERGPKHLPCCPTDQQAEVLIPDRVPLADIIGVAVSSETQAKNECLRLQLAGVETDGIRFVLAPVLFDKYELNRHIQSKGRPTETPWKCQVP